MILSGREHVIIKDIEEAVKLITQRASRVMSKVSYVLGETRPRMQMVVEQLGYHPRTLAQRLSQHFSYTLGIVTVGLKYIGPSLTLNLGRRSTDFRA